MAYPSYTSLPASANASLQAGNSVYGHPIAEGQWTNPQFNPDQNANGYTRFTVGERGSGLERALTFDDAAGIWNQYEKSNSPLIGQLNQQFAQQGITNPTAENKFDALDQYFQGEQYKNRLPPRHFGIKEFLGTALPIAANFIPGLQGWGGVALKGALGGALGGGILGGNFSSALKGGLLGAAGGVAGKGLSNLWNSGSLLGDPTNTLGIGQSAAGYAPQYMNPFVGGSGGPGLSTAGGFIDTIRNNPGTGPVSNWQFPGAAGTAGYQGAALDTLIGNNISQSGGGIDFAELAKKYGPDVLKLLKPDAQQQAAMLPQMGGGGQQQRNPFIANRSPPPPGLPDYFNYDTRAWS